LRRETLDLLRHHGEAAAGLAGRGFASMVALSARRLVCAAMREMRLTTSPTRLAAAASRSISALEPLVSATA